MPADELWRLALGVEDHKANHFRKMFAILPASRRCRLCNAPFTGPMVPLLRAMDFSQSTANPYYCRQCLETLPPGGAEMELTMFFADVRGSTELAEKMTPRAFSELINRFYVTASNVLMDGNALTGRLIGDEVMGLFVPGFAGMRHAECAIHSAQNLLRAVGYGSADGPWISIGVGINTGTAFVGRFGEANTTTDVTAVGDAANLAARLASQAAGGEILISDPTARAAHVDSGTCEARTLSLKGKSEPVLARSLRVSELPA